MNTIKSGTLYSFNNRYSIYELSNNNITYYLSMPNNDINNYKIYLGFPVIETKDASKETITMEIKNIMDIIHTTNPNGIYVYCNIPRNELVEAANDNDSLLYERLLNKVSLITSDSYKVINENNNVSIDSVIYLVKQTDEDTKFINWLEVKLYGFVNGISINKLKQTYDNYLFNNTNEQVFSGSSDGSGNGPRGLSGGGGTDTLTNNNTKVKKLIKPIPKHGYTSFTFIILVLSIMIGIGIAYLFIK